MRFLLTDSHYRSHINYSEENLQIARGALDRFYTALRGLVKVTPLALSSLDQSNTFVQQFIEAMDDDFNTSKAMAVLFELVRELNTARQNDADNVSDLQTLLVSLADVFGLLQQDPEAYLQAGAEDDLSAEAIEAKIAERNQAKLDKNYARADEIREELKTNGVILEDSREGTTWKRE